MFENNPYRLPEDKFSYVCMIMQRCGIIADWQQCDNNPFLDIDHCQRHRNLRAKYQGNESQRVLAADFRHYQLILRCGDIAESLYFSDASQNNEHDQGFSATDKALYYLVIYLWHLCHNWRHVLDDQMYLWAESNGCVDFLDDDYLHARFEYDKNNLNILIKIFGEDILTDIMDCFSRRLNNV